MKVAIIILIVLYFLTRKSKDNTAGKGMPPLTEKPVTLVPNDKIIIINNLGEAEAKQALQKLCNQYNKERYAILPRIYTLAEKEHAITFPYDTDLTMFCFAVNFMKYPAEVIVYGWAAVNDNEGISGANLSGKEGMFYLVDDNEHDNVYITSSDNLCYKVAFTNFKVTAVHPPAELFRSRPAKLADLSNFPYENIE